LYTHKVAVNVENLHTVQFESVCHIRPHRTYRIRSQQTQP